MFKEWVPNDHFTAKRNTDYWRTGLPYLDAITYRPITDAQTARQRAAGRATSTSCTPTCPRASCSSRTTTSYGFLDDSEHIVGEPDMNFIMLNLAGSRHERHPGPPGHGHGHQLQAVLRRSSTRA